jgi:aminoglycoside phosphotransferase (APT) family kinase protein
MSDDIQGPLQATYTSAFPEKQDVQIRDIAHITTGWESDIYSFTLEHGPTTGRQHEELILRIYPGDDAHAKSAREFESMRLLHEMGYPVPQVLILEREHSPFGQPFVIMEKIVGQTMWPLLFRSSGEAQQKLLTQFCDLFVRLHGLEWRPFVDATEHHDGVGDYAFVDGWLATAHQSLAALDRPDFLPIVEWLEKRRDDVPCPRPSVTHQDYHPENVLVRDDGLAVIIDWTNVAISDARFDLAWTLVLVSSYEGIEWRDRMLQEYERLAGAKVEQFEVFEVAACARRLASVVISLADGPEKMGMRPDAVTMMRQQLWALERVYELLLERTGIKMAAAEELFASSL